LNIGIIGCGYWGPKLIRNFSSLPNCNIYNVSDLKPGRLESVRKEFEGISTTLNYKEIINDKDIHAVCIATPVHTHKAIAEEALKAGKHVFVEKPFTSNSKDAVKLVKLARSKKRKLAVGHVFQFAPAVRKIKSLIQEGAVGKILHVTSTRINLGPPKSEVDVIWDLGPHDFSIILHILNEVPYKISSIKNSYTLNQPGEENPPNKVTAKNGLVNNAHIYLNFRSGPTAHIHLSWLSSNKVRLMQIFGTEGTIIYDEMLALDGKVKLLGKGIDNRLELKDSDTSVLSYATGEIKIIPLEQHEPLRMECEEFVNAVLYNKPLANDGEMGLKVVKLLEASS
jgi:predicted dehydrogenase